MGHEAGGGAPFNPTDRVHARRIRNTPRHERLGKQGNLHAGKAYTPKGRRARGSAGMMASKELSPDEAVGGVQRMPDLALPVVIVGDQAAPAGPFVRDAAASLTCCVDLRFRNVARVL